MTQEKNTTVNLTISAEAVDYPVKMEIRYQCPLGHIQDSAWNFQYYFQKALVKVPGFELCKEETEDKDA